MPEVLRARAEAADSGRTMGRKSVILLWMAGGPSQIDTWDPKPERPAENRGPFATISTAAPGIHVCEHLPKQAAMMDRFTILRSVDAGAAISATTGNSSPCPLASQAQILCLLAGRDAQ